MSRRPMRFARWDGMALGIALGALAPLAGAQDASQIVRDGSVGPDASAQPIAIPDGQGHVGFEIDESLGQRPGGGPNLFHSFSVFDLAAGDRAVFTANPALHTERVLSRVTGGRPSLLYGVLESRIPGADFYFLNPAGIVFGPDARLDVGGSVIATTANALELGAAGAFEARADAPVPLLGAPGVAAFGFLDRPASIEVLGARLAVPHGETLALVGGDLALDGADLAAPAGRIELASVGSAGRVGVHDSGAALTLGTLGGFSTLGSVALRGARLLADGAGGRGAGSIAVRARDLALMDGSGILAEGRSGAAAGTLQLDADSIRLASGSFLSTAAFGGGAGGLIDVQAGSLRLDGGSVLAASGFEGSRGGDIVVLARDVALDGASAVFTESNGAAAGRILLSGDAIRLAGGSFLSTSGFGGGAGGAIGVAAGSLGLDGMSGLFADGNGGGAAGRISVDARAIRLASSFLGATGRDGGDAGQIDIVADSLALDADARIAAPGLGGSRGGRIGVRARDIELRGSSIFVEGNGSPASGGGLLLDAQAIRLTQGSVLSSSGFDGASGGGILLLARTLSVTDSLIAADASGGGDAGQIGVAVESIRLLGGGQLSVDGTRGSSGGAIVLRAADAFFSGAVGDGSFDRRTGLSASSFGGVRSGAIHVEADMLRVTDQTRILAVGFPAQFGLDVVLPPAGPPGGDISLDVGSLLLTGGAQINTGSILSNGGSIAITARDLVDVSNEGGGPFSIVQALNSGRGGGSVDFGGIFAASGEPSRGSSGGGISIAAREIRIRDDGFVGAATFGGADAGVIRLDAERIRVTDGGVIDSSTSGTGAAALVNLNASESIELSGQNTQGLPTRIRSFTVGSGAAGNIVLRSPTIEIDGAVLVTSTLQPANGTEPASAGTIKVHASTLALRNGALIDSSSLSTGSGGRIAIDASERVDISGASSVSAVAAASGDGGAIRIATPDLTLRDGSTISTGSNLGFGNLVSLKDIAEAKLFVAPPDVPSGSAGAIELGVSTVRLSGGSRISTLAVQGTGPEAASRPSIDIAAARSVELSGGSEVTASVIDGRGGDIRIATPGAAILRDGSRVVAQAEGDAAGRFRQGGRIDIAAGVLLQDAGSFVSAGAGQGISGSVSINAPEVDLESELTRLPLGFLDAAALFKPRCAAAAERADASSFVLAAQTALPPSPEEWLVALGADAAAGAALPHVAASKRSVEIAEAAGDAEQLATALGRLGNAFLEVEDPQRAEPYLMRALALARVRGTQPVTAALLNDLGNARAARGAFADALPLYLESAEHARGGAALRARANAARAALGSGDLARAAALAEQTEVDGPREERASREERAALIHLGVTWRSLAERLPERRAELLLRANRAFELAAEQSAASRDFAAASYALGNRGGLYEGEQRDAEALELTRQALAAAERDGSPYAQYRWHAQLGRLLWAQGRANDALNAHRRAVRILRESRHELAYLYGRSSGSFGDSTGPVYAQLVRALLEASSLVVDAAQAQALLLEARDVVEQLKAAELRDHFRDECLAELESRSLPLDAVSPRSAVVYPIVLPDRLEILLTLSSGLKRYTVPVSGAALADETLRFRTQLGQYATSRYLESSWKLYDWLVRPYAAALAEANVQTLVFVTGGPLRTIPLGALHDRKKFLLESYAVAVTPSLALTDPRPLELAGRKVLLAGVSEPVQGFSALPSVDAELRAIEAIHGGTLLLDRSFTAAALREKLADVEYSAVHVASHARFTGGIDGSFLLAYDGPVSIRELSDAVRATRFRERPLELLVMSACETAAGDEQAALGLAGVALKAGARSAVGSLWNLNDRSATELMSGFYRALGTPGVSKAEALRRAQLGLIRKGAHPYFWSPFLVIGNWL